MTFIEACLLIRSLCKRLDVFHGWLKENILFIHIPRCGGTSIEHAIMKRYSDGECVLLNGGAIIGAVIAVTQLDPATSVNRPGSLEPANFGTLPLQLRWLEFQESLFLYFMHRTKTRFIAGGHCRFNYTIHRQFYNRYRFITILRDPVERWISAYCYYRHNKLPLFRIIDCDLRTYIESEAGKLQGCSYVTYLGGVDEPAEFSSYSSKKAIDRAKQNLHKFDIVGSLEYLDDFQRQFESRFGVRLRIGRRNKGLKPYSFRSTFITEEIEREIREICKPDLEIYQYCLDNFVNR